jgi:hypothetical protein
MTTAQQVVNALLEAEPEEYLKTRHVLRDQQGMTDSYFRAFPTSFGQPHADKGQDIGFTSGSRTFEREGGVWYEVKRKKNPEYYNQPRYFILAPGPGKMTFIVVKMPRTVNTRVWRVACNQIYRDATGYPWDNVYGAKGHWTGDRQRAVVDGADEEIWQQRASGQKPEPAYEIFADGTWKRIK